MSRARLFVIAGPNGAGKSSVAEGICFKRGVPRAKPIAPKGSPQIVRLRHALLQRCDYTFQTPLGDKITAAIEAASAVGAEVRMWFVGLASPELHVERVETRAARGGRYFPPEQIRAACEVSHRNLLRLLPTLSELYVYDNSSEIDMRNGRPPTPTLVLHVAAGAVRYRLEAEHTPAWAHPVVHAALTMTSATSGDRAIGRPPFDSA